MSREYGLYRQNWCGCIYSRQERERKVAERETAPDRKAGRTENP